MKKKKNLLKEKSRFSPTSLAVVIYKTLPRFGVKVLTPLCAILCGNKCPPEIPQFLQKIIDFQKCFSWAKTWCYKYCVFKEKLTGNSCLLPSSLLGTLSHFNEALKDLGIFTQAADICSLLLQYIFNTYIVCAFLWLQNNYVTVKALMVWASLIVSLTRGSLE